MTPNPYSDVLELTANYEGQTQASICKSHVIVIAPMKVIPLDPCSSGVPEVLTVASMSGVLESLDPNAPGHSADAEATLKPVGYRKGPFLQGY